jgi:hypothetical protein
MYRCFERTGDALVSELQAHSLLQFSLLVFCERSFPSVYEALQRKTHLLKVTCITSLKYLNL